MTAHSPLPWTARRSCVTGDGITEILDATGREVNARGFGLSGDDKATANAELMFRAVNAHDELVAALNDMIALVNISYGNLHEDVNEARAKALAALSKAEGK